MKNQKLEKGKKLSKKELKTITGGKKICKPPCALGDDCIPDKCTSYGWGCIELECQVEPNFQD